MLTTEQIRAMPWAERGKVSMENLLLLLGEKSDVQKASYVVGKWIWVQFEKKPDAGALDFLKGLGFRWNKMRKAWQHPCGYFCRRSDDDPTEKYAVQKVTG